MERRCVILVFWSFKILEFLFLSFFHYCPMKSPQSEEKRKNRTVSTFLKKTYELLNDSENSDCVRWAPSGIGFIIINEESFSRTILPKYFKHSNYSSFVRQLNMYNFHKIRENSQESYFHHEHFNSHDKDELAQIKRKPQKKKKKSHESDDAHSEVDSKEKKHHKTSKHLQTLSKIYIPREGSHKETGSARKVESQKITQNMFDEEGNGDRIRLPISESSDQLSMQVEEEEEKPQVERRMPGVPTKELICASKNNIIPMSVSVENVQTSILSIFY